MNKVSFLVHTMFVLALFAMPQSLEAQNEAGSATQSSSDKQKSQDSDEILYRTPTVEVIGTERDMERIPGSGEVVGQDQIDLEQYISIQDALREVPGVHLRSEDGVGLVPNIGIRGLNPDRSEKLLILEDGMPASLAPFNENAAYYIPPIERMERIELLKGSGSILYGPQTVGGVLNLITPKVPKAYRSQVQVEGGTDSYVLTRGNFGKTWGAVGLDTSLLYKRGDGFRDASDFRLANFTGKLLFDLGKNTKVIFKNNYHDQHSSQTYLGLTEQLFQQNSDFNPSPFDRLDVTRYDSQLTLQHFFTDEIELLTNFYYWYAHRNWNRQDYSRNTGFAPAPSNTVATYGNTSLDGGAIYMRESFGARDRFYQGAGVEPRLKMDYDLWGQTHHLEAGVKFHWERMADSRNNSPSLNAPTTTFSKDIRTAYDFAFFFQNTFKITKDLALIPGFRLEHYTQKRHTLVDAGAAVDFKGQSTNTVLIPGFGITYQVPGNTTLFTGIHRGFAPPRAAQAISSTGQDRDLSAELSWNVEAGARTRPYEWLKAEGTFFYMDFTNQVVPANQSGGASTTDTNAGQTRHLGFELMSSLDMLGAFGVEDHQFFLEGQYTFVDAKNTTPNGTFNGKDLPYAPRHMAQIGVRYNPKNGIFKGFEIGTEGVFTSSQFADQANTVLSNNAGTIGKIPSYWVMNAYARYRIPETRVELNLVGNNILNNNYIVSRAPEGVFPGASLQVLGGIKYDFF